MILSALEEKTWEEKGSCKRHLTESCGQHLTQKVQYFIFFWEKKVRKSNQKKLNSAINGDTCHLQVVIGP